jgi:hypothetical protein
MIEVMDGCARACDRTSWPMKPLEPVSMTFMFDGGIDLDCIRIER